jgi:hypothetical protein
MKSTPNFWQRIGLQDWFLKKEADPLSVQQTVLTPNDVYHYILAKFAESIGQLSFADRVVFYHEYIICLSPEDHHEFMNTKKGLFGLIVQESVKKFYEALVSYKQEGKFVAPSSSKWVFRFVSHPDYARGDMGFIGKLLPDALQQQENLRVTFIPRQTGIAQTFDVNQDILKGFTFYSEGYYEVPFTEELLYDEKTAAKSTPTFLARFETIVPDKAMAGKKLEFTMNEEEITVSGNEETRTGPSIFRIPSEWVNTPHLKIRYNKKEDRFYLSSFGEKTMLNEKVVDRSEEQSPQWLELPINSRIVLNGIVGVNIFKS